MMLLQILLTHFNVFILSWTVINSSVKSPRNMKLSWIKKETMKNAEFTWYEMFVNMVTNVKRGAKIVAVTDVVSSALKSKQ